MGNGLHLDQVRILKDGAKLIEIDTHVAPGSVLTIMGPSGVGKSTLLSAIIGTLPPAFALHGHVRLKGRDLLPLPPEDRCVGILFQDALLFPASQRRGQFGLRAGPKAARVQIDARRSTPRWQKWGLSSADRDPPKPPVRRAAGTGGADADASVRAKGAVAGRAFSGLDAALREQVRALVFDHAKARALPVLMVTP